MASPNARNSPGAELKDATGTASQPQYALGCSEGPILC